MIDANTIITQEFNAHLKTIESIIDTMEATLEEAALLVVKTLKNGNKVLLCGNGGSAADAQHIAAELTGRYKTERIGLPAIALTTDTSALTAISNDFGYNRVFDRQVEALANKGDLLIGISTSGNSENILSALKLGKTIGCTSIGLSGNDGGKMNELCDINLTVPSNDTPRIQEMHILLGHTICHIVDEAFK
ncbi:MAG: Phosphoheptose isomerase 1 (EC [uncultured Sulfurovum sp.]|uniref:Phosphoheptose isomerase n=1 Tax=uncultured Sulfurovum sp. TaxID=269237 RepID=A0A6S6TUQ0_9BACT|nr:MAG: Phosphoheptose isomerase 1 (EC [uncultured Sulfurovum sp.]